MIRVLLADDEAMIRAGVTAILAAGPDIEVVAQAADGPAGVGPGPPPPPPRARHPKPQPRRGRP
ncbi:hypothetical protein ACFWJH_36180, partial [Streptomyces lasiicapitis]